MISVITCISDDIINNFSSKDNLNAEPLKYCHFLST